MKKYVYLLFLNTLFNAFAQTGPFEKLDQLAKIDRTEIETIIENEKQNTLLISKLGDSQKDALSVPYLRSLFFHSERRYLNLIDYHPCHFYNLLGLGGLTSNSLPSERVLVLVKDDNQRPVDIPFAKKDYLSAIYKQKCYDNIDLNARFSASRFKNALKSVKFPLPTDEQSCRQIISNWKKRPEITFLCHAIDSIREGRKIKKKLSSVAEDDLTTLKAMNDKMRKGKTFLNAFSLFQLNYAKNLCSSLEEKNTFCPMYLSNQYWDKVINREKPIDHLFYRCQDIHSKKNLDEQDLSECRSQLNRSPQLCHHLSNRIYPSLLPAPSCPRIEKALDRGRLKASYMDCTGAIDNEGMTNIFRIYQHFSPQKITSDERTCATNTVATFAQFNTSQDNDKAWDTQICYNDAENKKEICLPSLFNYHPTSPYSEEKVVKKLLQKVIPFDPSENCQIVAKKKFNPLLLKYKHGCFIVYRPSQCTMSNCPKSIYYRNKKLENIVYKGQSKFQYFAQSYSKRVYSMEYILNRALQLKSKKITNLTEATLFLQKNPEGIIHGSGCIEHFLPALYPAQSFNQCSPTYFIIDGFKKEGDENLLVTRLAIDSVHSPRLLSWNTLYSGIKFYSKRHPIGKWPLYGLR